MIFRITQKLNRKVKAGALAELPMHDNPYTDWSARLFTADRTQYILLSNTVSLYSVVMYGRGITDSRTFIDRAMESIRESMTQDGLELLYRNFIADATGTSTFAKALNRSVIGSMNEFQWHAQDALVRDGVRPLEVGAIINAIPCRPLSTPEYQEYAKPREAIRYLMA